MASQTGLARAIWATIIVWIVILPLTISPQGKETFRVPKDVLFIGVAIILAAFGVVASVGSRGVFGSIRRQPVAMVSAGVLLWSSITTLTASNRAIAISGLIWVISAVVIALAIALTAGSR